MDVAVAVGAIAPVPVEREAVSEVISWEEVVLAAVPDLAKGGTVGTVAGGVAARFESARSQEWRTSVVRRGIRAAASRGRRVATGWSPVRRATRLSTGVARRAWVRAGVPLGGLFAGAGLAGVKGEVEGAGGGSPRRAVAR